MVKYATAVYRSTMSVGFFGGSIEKQGTGQIHAVPWSESEGSAARTLCDLSPSDMENITPDGAGTWPAPGVSKAIECPVCASEIRKKRT